MTGSVGKRFSTTLREQLVDGSYIPSPAYFVSVPKRAHTTRPAALLALPDRIVLEALVAALRDRIDARLVSNSSLFWPRGLSVEREWSDFEHAPLGDGSEFTVTADVARFYESVDHEQLSLTLLAMTGRELEVKALADLLGQTMGRPRGIPQGVASSDQLATAYLSPVDAAMLRAGFEYFRNGDDPPALRALVCQSIDASRSKC